jgi:NAD(P)-dependent dehydrogenase (short-subunit alcohol dehydrogenase family)
MPVGFDRLRCWAAPVGRVRGAVRLREEAGSVEADVELLDAEGTPLVEVSGLRLAPVAASRPADRDAVAWLYETVWRPEAQPVAAAVLPGTRHLLLASDAGGRAVAETVALQLRHAGADPEVASLGAALEALRSAGSAFDSVICVLAAGQRGGPERAVRVAEAALEVVRALTSRGGAAAPALWLVTRGAQPVIDGEAADPFGATAWGLARVIPFENPALRCRCVDLDPADPERAAEGLVDELAAPSDEAEIGYRAGLRYVRRLTPAAPLEPPPAAGLRLEPDGTYLLTGGLGGLGRQIARRLLERGARRLALLGRGAPDPAAAAAIAELRGGGASVEFLQADVTSPDELGGALDRVRATGSALRGVVHLAGVLDDRPLMATDDDTLAAVIGPKAAGSWNLLELTAADPVDWIVCFSSAASVLGSPGQGAYCAANAAMDALASHERSRGRPVCCLNWGPWGSAGMAARAGQGAERRFGSAYTALDPADGLDILERAVAAGRTGLLVMPFDLRNLLQFYPVGLGLPFFGDLTSGDVARLRSIGQGSQPARRPDLGQGYVAPRSAVEERIASMWQASLGIDRVGVLDEFFELGGDSVFANEILVEVSRSLGVSVDAARAFENFTVAGLAALAEEAMVEQLRDMTEEEAERLAGRSASGEA